MTVKKRFSVLLLCLLLALCTGCEASDPDISTQARSLSFLVGLNVPEGELKESGAVFEDGPVEFQDPVIEEMLRNLLGKPEGDVLRSELQSIHAIYWRSDRYWSNLQSEEGFLPVFGSDEDTWPTKQPLTLADLAYCDNLQRMEFGEIMVPSLEPLAVLPQLETIEFEQASITASVLDELGDLPHLNTLLLAQPHLEGSDWGDLTDGSFLLPLADQLTRLAAEGGIQWNTDVLAQMTHLEFLSIAGATDLSFLENLTELKQLVLDNCFVDDWSALSSLSNLEYLTVHGDLHKTVDLPLDALRPLKKLDYLSLGFTTLDASCSRKEIADAIPSLTAIHIL